MKLWIDYLTDGSLPREENQARKIVLQSSQLFLLDGVLYHLNFKTRHRRAVVPTYLRPEILRKTHAANIVDIFLGDDSTALLCQLGGGQECIPTQKSVLGLAWSVRLPLELVAGIDHHFTQYQYTTAISGGRNRHHGPPNHRQREHTRSSNSRFIHQVANGLPCARPACTTNC